MNKEKLREILAQPFNYEDWKLIFKEIFADKVNYFTQIHPLDAKEVKSGGQVGTIRLDDGRSLAMFVLEVTDNVQINRNRKKLRNIAIKPIDQSLIHGSWVLYYSKRHNENYRLTYVTKQTSFSENGELLQKETDPKRYTFLLGKNERCKTASDRLYELKTKRQEGSIYLADITEAFSVERLNKEFFKGYKEQYEKFLKYITDTKQHRDYVKKLLGRLVFLQFLQKKGWLGVPASNTHWEGGDKDYLANLIKRYDGNNRLLSDVLEPLFFYTLNEPREKDIADSRLGENIKIPYLNGGLFDKDQTDYLDIDFPYAYFEKLLEFFASYNFTIDENDPDDSEVGIDPEMLGHIFENLLEDNKDKGAFYTPKEIVQYMCRQSVIQYLKTHEPDEKYTEAIEQLINKGKLDQILQTKSIASRFTQLLNNVKVCDPAIGSGAFPMGILYVLYHAIHKLHPYAEPHGNFDSTQIKRNIIQNNIFGVDIEQGAVDIARLRFWLALVVDAEAPQPLPNLDYKIMQGNSLIERYANIDLTTLLHNQYSTTLGHELAFEEEITAQKKLQKQLDAYYDTSNHVNKNSLRNEIQDKIIELIQAKHWEKYENTKMNQILDEIRALGVHNDKFFLWHTWFADVFTKNGGFDIVIGNPPYGAKLSSEEKKLYKDLFSDVHMRTPETFCYFISMAFRLASKVRNGIIAYIVPNNMFFQNENEKTRSLILFKNQLIRAINLGDNTFENADVPTCIFIASSNHIGNYDVKYSDYRKYHIKDIDWNNNYESISIDLIKTVPTYVLGLSNLDIQIINDIKRQGITIDSIAEEMASGISTGGDKIFRIPKTFVASHNLELQPLYPVLIGAEIDKYLIKNTNHIIIYSTKQADIPSYLNLFNYLLPYEEQLSKKRETRKGTLPWWCLHWPRYEQLFVEPKIIMRQTSDNIRCVYDQDGYFTLNSVLVFKKNTKDYSYKYIATILNSKLANYLYKKFTQEEGRTFAEVKPANVRKLYIPHATREEQALLSLLYDYMAYLRNPEAPQVDTSITNQFAGNFFERIIDGCVYELFFKDHMTERGINIIDYLYSLIMPVNGNVEKAIEESLNRLYKTNNEVRTRLELFVSRSPEYLKIIIQS